ITNLPEELITEDKFGSYIRGINPSTQMIEDELLDDHEKALTIKLTVDKELEPKWVVICDRHTESKSISASDRGKLNMFLTSDLVDRHFSWAKGNPLYSLFKDVEGVKSLEENIILDALRTVKPSIDGAFSKLDATTKVVKNVAAQLGLDISNASTTVDHRDLAMKDSKVSLHEGKIPFRLKGKGSKRLASIAIQSAIASVGGIILIDEIEQGLEPDRVQNLVSVLKEKNEGQIFITTHSRDVMVELDASNLFLFRKGKRSIKQLGSIFQSTIRSNPEAFFSNKVIVCEGETEVGICRALNSYRIKQKQKNTSYLGVSIVKGGGSSFAEYCAAFKNLEYPTAVFCDSDDIKPNGLNSKKRQLLSKGIPFFDWEDGDCLEMGIFKNISSEKIGRLIKLVEEVYIKNKGVTSAEAITAINQSLSSKSQTLPSVFDDINCTEDLRKVLGEISSKNRWYKTISEGFRVGEILFDDFDAMPDNKLKQMLQGLNKWIDNGS
ncbi:MAG: ATP-dependent nuclease, partial [Candidatus Pacearchaeota archaeon]